MFECGKLLERTQVEITPRDNRKLDIAKFDCKRLLEGMHLIRVEEKEEDAGSEYRHGSERYLPAVKNHSGT